MPRSDRLSLPLVPATRAASGWPAAARFAFAAAFACILALAGPALAQQPLRTVPGKADAGVLEMKVFPEALLDDKPVRLGAGARIHDLDNRIVMPATLSGRQRVLYTRDGTGLVDRVWLATQAEYDAAQKARP